MKSDLSARPRPPAHQRDNTFFSFFFKATELGLRRPRAQGPGAPSRARAAAPRGSTHSFPRRSSKLPLVKRFPRAPGARARGERPLPKGGEGEGRSWAWPCPAAERSTHPRLACEVRAGDPQAENKGDAPARSARARARPSPSPSPPREMAAAPQNGSRRGAERARPLPSAGRSERPRSSAPRSGPPAAGRVPSPPRRRLCAGAGASALPSARLFDSKHRTASTRRATPAQDAPRAGRARSVSSSSTK